MGMNKYAGLITHFTRRDPGNYIPVFAGMALNGGRGSGELNMATNVAGGLRDAGFNAVLYNPTPEKIRSSYSYYRRHRGLSPEDAFREVMHADPNDPEAVANASLYRLGQHMYTMPPIESLKGKSIQELQQMAASGQFSPVLGMLTGETPRDTSANFSKFHRLLNRGAFDGITPGGLRDHLLKGRDDILNGRVVLGNPQDMFDPANTGKGRMFFDGHLGFTYSDFPYGKTPTVGGGVDLGKRVDFNANYRAGDTRPLEKAVIPFTDVGDTFARRIPGVSSWLARRDQDALRRHIQQGLGLSDDAVRGKKLVFLTGGGSGVDVATKLRDTYQALSNRDDLLWLVQGGTNETQFPEAQAMVNKLNGLRRGPNILLEQSLSPRQFRRFSGAADLDLSYGGSSTLSETLASKNPWIFMRDSGLNDGNIGWAKTQFGDRVHTFDPAAMAAFDYSTARAGVGNEGHFWRDRVGSHYVPGPDYSTQVPGIRDATLGGLRPRAMSIMDPAAERDQLSRLLNDMLDNPGPYRRQARAMSGKFRSALRSANGNTVSTAARINGGLRLGNARIPWWLVRFGRRFRL